MFKNLANQVEPLLPRLAADALATEQRGHTKKSVINELKRSGFFRIFQPRQFGGYELEFYEFVTLMSSLGRGCGSTAWVCSVGSFHAFNVALFGQEAQNDVWKLDPLAAVGSSYVPAGSARLVKGGFELSGTWPYVSGCDHFEWTIVSASYKKKKENRLYFCLIPRSDYIINDDWDVTGLRGSGSKSISMNEVFVPEHRILDFASARSGNTPGAKINLNSLYKTPFFACSSYCLVSPAIGIAERALGQFIQEIGPRKVKSLRGQNSNMAEHYPVQTRVSEASALIEAAKLIITEDCKKMSATINKKQQMSTEQKLKNKRNQVIAIQFLKRAIDLLVGATGTKGLLKSNTIQLAAQNIHAIGTHITLNYDIVMPTYGRHVLGLDAGVPI